ncbi:carbohydrate kinase family protein [Bittarella sp. HCP28S3_D9]|uniref:carbohydrate kinase family protein n=1 Tax=Bittarella sp. HCP28S3_D9 TaxID=3440253 RepID=UPI003F893B49
MERQDAPYLVFLGEACIDEYYETDRWGEMGDKMMLRPVENLVGGMVANAAGVAAGLGQKCYLVDSLSDSPVCRQLRAAMEAEGIDTSYTLHDPGMADPKCIIVTQGGERVVCVVDTARAPRRITPRHQRLLDGAAWIYTIVRTLQQVEDAEAVLDRARAAGAKLYLDVEGVVAEDNDPRFLRRADGLTFNEQGFAAFRGDRSEGACLKDLFAGGVEFVAVTLGPGGCRVHTPGRTIACPGLPVAPVDTTGAGDTWGAAFLWARVNGWALGDCARFANGMAARACTVLGARGGICTLEEARRWMDRAPQAVETRAAP